MTRLSSSSSLFSSFDVLEAARDRYKAPNCIPMARWNHGNKALKDVSAMPRWINEYTPDIPINVSRLERLQYFRADHPVRLSTKQELMGKMIVDISKIHLSNLSKSVSPHRPLPEPHCGKADVNFLESILVLNHYRGSWERYCFRNDTRRSYDQYEKENANYWKSDSTHYKIHQWLPKFVKLVGSEEKAAYLLGHQPTPI